MPKYERGRKSVGIATLIFAISLLFFRLPPNKFFQIPPDLSPVSILLALLFYYYPGFQGQNRTGGKQTELLLDAVPAKQRLGILWDAIEADGRRIRQQSSRWHPR
jgi:hypothetical protein